MIKFGQISGQIFVLTTKIAYIKKFLGDFLELNKCGFIARSFRKSSKIEYFDLNFTGVF